MKSWVNRFSYIFNSGLSFFCQQLQSFFSRRAQISASKTSIDVFSLVSNSLFSAQVLLLQSVCLKNSYWTYESLIEVLGPVASHRVLQAAFIFCGEWLVMIAKNWPLYWRRRVSESIKWPNNSWLPSLILIFYPRATHFLLQDLYSEVLLHRQKKVRKENAGRSRDRWSSVDWWPVHE